jgi:5,10-methenyltetrahydrofolate synthetase
VSAFPENPGQSDSVRAALRRHCLAAREALTEAQHHVHSMHIEDILFRHFSAQPPQTLAFCWPMRREFDPRPLMGRLLALGWQACMPVVIAPDTPMAFHRWYPEAAMKPGHYDIPVPAEAIELLPDQVLVPLVAFDAQGYRLGYGGGYFDRTLAALAPLPATIGVGFEVGRVDSIGPEAHDIPLDHIVTEAGFFSHRN